jgi:penicillin-binding protein 1A
LLAGLVVLLGLFLAAWYYVDHLKLPNPHPQLQATIVYGADGRPIGTFSEQTRVDVTLRQVPPIVIDAVVSTEDRHFFTEGAISPTSMARAMLSDLRGRGSLQGGSTITQQYVKQAYLSSQRTFTRKIQEVALAYRLSHLESKDQILQNYLNTIYWGRGVYGVEAASEAFFGKSVSQLGLPQASLLAGLIREPESADPATDPSLARLNQTDTLKALIRDHKITPAQAAAVEATPFSKYVIPANQGLTATRNGTDYFLAAVRQQLINQFGTNMVYRGGLRVTTTLDPNLQALAYQNVYGPKLPALNPAHGDPSGALVSMDDNGAVKALVGGQNYATSSVDLALGTAGGGSGRQAGSTFKAFMLAELIHEAYSVNSVFPAPPQLVIPGGNANGAPWVVTNYEHEAVAPKASVVDATALSINTVYAQIVSRIGAAKLDQMAKTLGIAPSELAHPYLSQVLGTADVSPLEMASAYATYASGGVYHAPILITKVTRSNGSALPVPVKPKTRTVLSPVQVATLDYVLQQVVTRGTGVAAGGVGSQVAGKTGTTEKSSDAWFIGYTPKLTTALWMGYASDTRSMDGFRGLGSVTGGTIPAQLWHNYMAAVLTAFPQFAGNFPTDYNLGGRNLFAQKPPPKAKATTTTSTTKPRKRSSTTTSRSPSPGSTVVGPGPATTIPGSPTTLAPPGTSPPTTTPPTTTGATTTTSTSTTSTTSTTVP